MQTHLSELTPVEITNLESRRSRISGFWSDLSFCDDSGGTTWDVLDGIRTEVMELLARGSPGDIRRAERLTAKAEFMIEGGSG